MPAALRLKEQGKIRFFGVTALGETGALHRALASGAIDTAQVCFNLLSPTAAYPMPMGFPAQDFDGLAHLAREQGVGTVGIRVLAGGALSGRDRPASDRHPRGGPDRLGPGLRDRCRSARWHSQPLVAEGYASSVVEAAFRFALTADALSTMLIGTSDLAQLEVAAAAVAKGPLPAPAMDRLRTIWAKLATA